MGAEDRVLKFVFLDAPPKTGVGKFDKKLLRQKVESYLASGLVAH